MKLTRCKLGKVLELQRGYDLPSSQMEKEISLLLVLMVLLAIITKLVVIILVLR